MKSVENVIRVDRRADVEMKTNTGVADAAEP